MLDKERRHADPKAWGLSVLKKGAATYCDGGTGGKIKAPRTEFETPAEHLSGKGGLIAWGHAGRRGGGPGAPPFGRQEDRAPGGPNQETRRRIAARQDGRGVVLEATGGTRPIFLN